MKPKLMLCLGVLTLATLSLVGCMVGEVTHTIYLEPDGSMTWVVDEGQMRSTEDDPRDRHREEADWLHERASETHDPAEAFWRIGASRVETLVARDRRPFHAITRATFSDPGDALERLFEASGLVGDIKVADHRRTRALAIRIDVEASEQNERAESFEESPVDSLFEGDRLRLVVARGRFVDAVGFAIDGETAQLDQEQIERALEGDPSTLHLYLEWQLED